MASADEIKIKVKGKSAHGAAAYLGVNAVAIASNIVTALQQMPIMETKYNDDVIMCIGKIEGGTRANIVPDEAIITMSFRAFTSEAREYPVHGEQKPRQNSSLALHRSTTTRKWLLKCMSMHLM